MSGMDGRPNVKKGSTYAKAKEIQTGSRRLDRASGSGVGRKDKKGGQGGNFRGKGREHYDREEEFFNHEDNEEE